jgi:uncharacterized protein with HEPN domain
MPPDDTTRLEHMLEAAQAASRFMTGRERADLDRGEMFLFALVRALEVIGEAAAQVSPTARALLPAIPWADIVRMRNRLIHAYFRINRNIVWNTALDDVPVLIAELEQFLATTSQSDEREEQR